MTIIEAYRACLIELNKVQAPSLLLNDFIYLFNKGIQQYVNKRYNLFETSQQLTDDLRMLVKTIKISKFETYDRKDVIGTSYKCQLPLDYVHILNCICEFKDVHGKKCEDSCSTFRQGANKLDTNQWSSIINNYYMRPSVKRPYYYIVNIEEPNLNPDYRNNNLKESGQRYGNSYIPTMEIKCGNQKNNYELEAVYIDYLRAPQYMSITQDELDAVEDKSTIIEFPDYVVYEIINELVTIIMENAGDKRLQSHVAVTQSIPSK